MPRCALSCLLAVLMAVACSRPRAEKHEPAPLAHGGTPCSPERAAGAPECLRFGSAEQAFERVLAELPAILAIGEAHAQRGSEGTASTTKRFTETLLPHLGARASDLLLEVWVGDGACRRDVAKVATAQKEVTAQQAATNPNEYVLLGDRAKALGVMPHVLRPTCNDYARLADAGDDSLGQMLALIEQLTEADALTLYRRNAAARAQKIVVTYGGGMHNDLAPPEATKAYSFGPALSRATGGRYVELDLIVPELVRKTPAWEKLPWFASFERDAAPRGMATLYIVGERSFVLVFPRSS